MEGERSSHGLTPGVISRAHTSGRCWDLLLRMPIASRDRAAYGSASAEGTRLSAEGSRRLACHCSNCHLYIHACQGRSCTVLGRRAQAGEQEVRNEEQAHSQIADLEDRTERVRAEKGELRLSKAADREQRQRTRAQQASVLLASKRARVHDVTRSRTHAVRRRRSPSAKHRVGLRESTARCHDRRRTTSQNTPLGPPVRHLLPRQSTAISRDNHATN